MMIPIDTAASLCISNDGTQMHLYRGVEVVAIIAHPFGCVWLPSFSALGVYCLN